nr:unnamed protein product [Callosobruchus analis]
MLEGLRTQIKHFNPTEVIYTGGSKTKEGVGAAFVSNRGIFKSKLHDIASICTAEPFAILQATNYIRDQTPGKFLICTDSLSTLQALGKQSSAEPVIRKILTNHQKLQLEYNEIIYVWSLEHIGIAGNEQADIAARQAIHDGTTAGKLRLDDMKVFMKEKCRQKWQKE